ncbi:hypothetical protein RDWZM_003094 [Blomia tropicalis]|uniref:Gustatory receptor n=1 Tax=Blomia tropicalis TaxID=40697 RepID=A0A9Q0MEZ4_BLOTA|nr:hypothetical protein RDWZM_003094 [Blomia tropicalis]
MQKEITKRADLRHSRIDNREFSFKEWKYSMIIKRLLMVCANLIGLAFSLLPFFNIAMKPNESNSANRTDDFDNQDNFEESEESLMSWITQNGNPENKSVNLSGKLFAVQDFGQFVNNIARGYQNSEEVSQLKPILRLITQWLIFVYLANHIFTIFYNLLFGGAYIRHMASIREFSYLDRNRSLATLLLGTGIVTIFMIKLSIIWLYQKELVISMIWPNEAEGEFALVKQKILAIHFSFELFLSLFQNLGLMMTSFLFIYSMIMFRRCIEHFQTDIIEASELDELQLSLMKTHLCRLNESFKRTINYLSAPITFDMMANTYMVIGSACFLIINQERGIQQMYAIAFIANIGLFALIRLVVVASVGNMATNACYTLSRLVYETKSEWNLQEWLCYIEIKRMPAEFEVSVFSVYSVQQSSILTMLGFALNYIVILLQTENYGSSSNSTTTINGTDMINITETVNNSTEN